MSLRNKEDRHRCDPGAANVGAGSMPVGSVTRGGKEWGINKPNHRSHQLATRADGIPGFRTEDA